mmetsp:Transcript_14177/g.30320  ORF Transcript_14177/g.30320 Transcript_14177/m.30320 type:complete len:515 (-) Transcript_14177:337-1881(-)
MASCPNLRVYSSRVELSTDTWNRQTLTVGSRPRPAGRASLTVRCSGSKRPASYKWFVPLQRLAHKKPKPVVFLPRTESLLNERFRTPSPLEYDYSRSTQENYTQDGPSWTGPFRELRDTLDHSYHGFYTESRQRLQDDLIRDVVSGGSTKKHPWIVFTAGAMGAGKGYVVRWMSRNGYFPLPDLVQIDPDNFKAAFPEWPGYVTACRKSAGINTRRESGYLVEVAQHVAMDEQKNVWVDGSLRDGDWYSKVFDTLRRTRPEYRIAILYVYAEKDVVLKRAADRAELTGREVPESELLDSIKRVPQSVEQLSHKADFTAHISNNPWHPEPKLERCESFGRPLKSFLGKTQQVCWNQISDRFATAKSLVARNKSKDVQLKLQTRLQSDIASHKVVLYSKTYCSFSAKVKSVLTELGYPGFYCVELDELPEDEGLALQLELSRLTDADGVPQVFVGGRYIGCCDSVLKMQAAGMLLPLLMGDEELSGELPSEGEGTSYVRPLVVERTPSMEPTTESS